MTRFDYYRCDECGKILENIECNSNQLMFALIGCSDWGGRVHFCGIKCLQKYTAKLKTKELKSFKDGNRPEEAMSIGEHRESFV